MAEEIEIDEREAFMAQLNAEAMEQARKAMLAYPSTPEEATESE